MIELFIRKNLCLCAGGQLLLNSLNHFGAEEVSLHPIAEYLVHCVNRVLRSSGRAGNSLSDLADVRAESVDQTVETFERGAFADRIDDVEQDNSVTIYASLRGDSLRYSASHLERVRTHRHFGDRFDGILGVSKLGEFGLEVTQ